MTRGGKKKGKHDLLKEFRGTTQFESLNAFAGRVPRGLKRLTPRNESSSLSRCYINTVEQIVR